MGRYVSRYVFLVRSCLFKCFKGQKSPGSLCSVVRTLIVSVGPSKGQGHLLSCSGQLNISERVLSTFESFWITRTWIVCKLSQIHPAIIRNVCCVKRLNLPNKPIMLFVIFLASPNMIVWKFSLICLLCFSLYRNCEKNYQFWQELMCCGNFPSHIHVCVHSVEQVRCTLHDGFLRKWRSPRLATDQETSWTHRDLCTLD